MHQFDIRVEPQMMRQAWHAWFFNRRSGWKLAIGGLLIGAAVILDLRSGPHLSTFSIVGVTILGSAILLYGVGYLAGLRRALAKHAAIVDGKARYALTDATIEASSSLGSFSLAWAAVTEVRRYHDLILLRFQGAAYSTIPAAQIPPDALAFLVEHAKAGGAKIRGI